MRNSLLCFLFFLFFSSGRAEEKPSKYADYVNTSIGAIDKRGSNCVIGPQLPYGSINPSPQTEKGGMDGYHPDYPIRGFGQLHVSGTGWGSYGHFLVSPQVGLDVSMKGHDSPHSDDVTKAYYYKTNLDRYNIVAEIAPAHYSAIYRFTYPASDESYLVFDASQSIIADIATEMKGTVLENSVKLDPVANKIRMTIKFNGGWPGAPYYLHLAGQYNRPAENVGMWEGNRILQGEHAIERGKQEPGQHLGAFCKFDTRENTDILLKLAISFTSCDKAEELLLKEIPDWDFEKVKEAGKNIWENKLSSIDIETTSEEQKIIFYSALYRSFTLARDRSLDNSKWDSKQPFWDDNYAFWDTFRTAYPLLTLVDEPAMRDNILALIDRFKHNGCIYDGFVASVDRTGEQGGNDVDHVIVDAYLKGVKGIDWNEAYKIVKYNADHRRLGHLKSGVNTDTYKKYKELGWIPNGIMSTSQTLEFAYNDYSVALMAQGLGYKTDYEKYVKRSHQWINLWNPHLESHGYIGFVDAKTEDGIFANIDAVRYGGSWTSPFYEASSWTYSYYVPHDFDVLINLMGGRDKFVERLAYGFEHRLIRYTNEPGFLATRAFTHAGRPDLSSYWVHDIMAKGYDLSGYPENDDTGSMASWYVFCSLGFFPNAGQDYYYLNAPLYPKSVIKLSSEKTLTVTANASQGNVYIKSCKVNGKDWNSPFIKHDELMNAKTIEMVLSETPTGWGK